MKLRDKAVCDTLILLHQENTDSNDILSLFNEENVYEFYEIEYNIKKIIKYYKLKNVPKCYVFATSQLSILHYLNNWRNYPMNDLEYFELIHLNPLIYGILSNNKKTKELTRKAISLDPINYNFVPAKYIITSINRQSTKDTCLICDNDTSICLDCKHTLCKQCIKSVINTSSNLHQCDYKINTISCPYCKRHTLIIDKFLTV